MNTTSQLTEKINLLAVTLLSAAAIHIAFCLFGIPHILASAKPGIGILVTAIKLTLSVGGILGGAYVGYNGFFMFNARSFAKARLAALGAIVLPFIGLCGLITGFILIPSGAACLLLFRLPEWRNVFTDELPVLGDAELQQKP
jgi:hypothetical protein